MPLSLARQAGVGPGEDGWGAKMILWDPYLPPRPQAEPYPVLNPT